MALQRTPIDPPPRPSLHTDDGLFTYRTREANIELLIARAGNRRRPSLQYEKNPASTRGSKARPR